jgi:hypothetical protein
MRFLPYSSISELLVTLRLNLPKLDAIIRNSTKLGEIISSDAVVHRFLRFSRQHFLKPYAISATEHKALYDSLIGEESTGFLDSVQENPRFLSWMKEMHTYFDDSPVLFTSQDDDVQVRLCSRTDTAPRKDDIVCIFKGCLSALVLREQNEKYLLVNNCTSDTGEDVDQTSFVDAEKKKFLLI